MRSYTNLYTLYLSFRVVIRPTKSVKISKTSVFAIEKLSAAMLFSVLAGYLLFIGSRLVDSAK